MSDCEDSKREIDWRMHKDSDDGEDVSEISKNIWNFISQFTPEARYNQMGPKWNFETLITVIDKAIDVIGEDPLVLDLTGEVNVIGPLYGQGDSLVALMSMMGQADRKQFLFLGNYLGFGFCALEVLMLVLCLKIQYPNNIYLLRGNFEDVSALEEFPLELFLHDRGIDATCIPQLFRALESLFDELSVAATLPKGVVCMNGGPGPVLREKGLRALQGLSKKDKARSIDELNIMNECMWGVFEPKKMTIGVEDGMPRFNEKEVTEWCKENEVELLVRGRQLVKEGVLNNPKRMLTIASAICYLDLFDNYSAGLTINGKKVTVNRYRMSNKEAKNFDYAKFGVGRNLVHF